MFCVIFNVRPINARRTEAYLGHALELRPQLQQMDGFIDIERFASREHDGRLLSLSTWRDEKAVIRWRTHAHHHEIQEKGRFELFADYFLRVGEITTDTHVPEGHTVREERFDETEIGNAKVVTLVEIPAAADNQPAEDAVRANAPLAGTIGLTGVELYDNMYNAGKVLVVAGWRDWTALGAAASSAKGAANIRRRTVRVIREYGMYERREAPQYYPPVERSTSSPVMASAGAQRANT